MMQVLLLLPEPAQRQRLVATVRAAGLEPVEVTDAAAAWAAVTAEVAPRIVVLEYPTPESVAAAFCRLVAGRPGSARALWTVALVAAEQARTTPLALAPPLCDCCLDPGPEAELPCRLLAAVRAVKAADQAAAEFASLRLAANRLAVVSAVSGGLVHELNNGLTLLSGNLGVTQLFWGDLCLLLEECRKHQVGDAAVIDALLRDMPDVVAGMSAGVERIRTISTSLRLFSHAVRGSQSLCRLETLVDEALVLAHNRLKHRFVVQRHCPKPTPSLLLDPVQCQLAVVNLLLVVAALVPEGGGTVLNVSVTHDEGRYCIVLEHNGPALSPDWGAHPEQPPSQAPEGISLTVCQHFVAAHGGTVRVANRPEGGARFEMVLIERQDE